MRGSYAKHYEQTDAVEQAARENKQAAELRLAKLHNTPKAKLNTPWSEPAPAVRKG